MTIQVGGQGQQLSNGNPNELILGVTPAPQTAAGAATLTVAQVMGKILVGSAGTSGVNYTLPTAAALDTAMGSKKNNTSFDLTIINLGTSSGVITVVAGTGITLVGMATLPITTTAGSSGTWKFRKTGTAAWTAYRIS